VNRFPQAWLTLPAVALTLLAAGCGGDDEGGDTSAAPTAPTTETTAASTPETTTAPEAQGDTPVGGEDAAKQVVLDYTFKGSCETMTDKFLDTQAFSGETREEKCEFFEKTFQKPQYSEDDLKFRKVEVSGDTASVVVGSDIANVESEYKLVAEGGQWKIDEFDIL
jgi:hypothetical protein